jgi:hypothetical protein
MLDTIDFDAILANIAHMPAKQLDPSHTLAVTQTHNGVGRQEYAVRVPTGYMLKLDDMTLLTRCDNGTHDLRSDPGSVCHFGGYVEWENNPCYCKVVVYID